MKIKAAFVGSPHKRSIEFLSVGLRSDSRGFTLIEVLIALTLLSVMVVLLFASLKIGTDSWEKGENKITEVNEIAVVYNFFQQHLSVAKPLSNDSPEGEQRFSFQGAAQSLMFVSEFPASAARSGLQHYLLSKNEVDNEQLINVSLIPYIEPIDGEEPQKEEITLIRHVKDFKLSYFGADTEGSSRGVWTDEWLNKNILPRLVKIKIELESGIYWPEMIIELKVSDAIDSNTGIGLNPIGGLPTNPVEAFR
ncbi:MAG: prepilin-type N-terminal cleavage/methylation domain-containing protein [Methylococcales bacterium]|jgi:general secretion pathway protein J|nr:MAG: prepilin-type N-terminal cleavage/methylation domain-containing protein [Methylococcales bacterium]